MSFCSHSRERTGIVNCDKCTFKFYVGLVEEDLGFLQKICSVYFTFQVSLLQRMIIFFYEGETET